MSHKFIQLNRTFTIHNPEESPEEAANQSYLAAFYGLSGEKTWSDLLEHGCTVVLGEPGSGKTWEFESQVEKLCDEGATAFILRLEELVRLPIPQLLDPKGNDQFLKWMSTDFEVGYFFLDARDEAQLENYLGFEIALRNLSDSLGPAISRAKIIISSRIIGWRGVVDEDLLARYILRKSLDVEKITTKKGEVQRAVDGEIDADSFERVLDAEHAEYSEAPAILVVRLSPLSEAQVRKFAEVKISKADSFVDAIDRRDIWSFTRRPLDVEGLIQYWIERGDLGSLGEIIEFDVSKKLDDPNIAHAKSDPLSRNLARQGANTLALASTLCRRLNFLQIIEGAQTEDQTETIDPRAILPNWLGREIAALQNSETAGAIIHH